MTTDLRFKPLNIDLASDFQKIQSFILFYPSIENPKYLTKQSKIAINLTDLYIYDDALYQNLLENTLTYLNMFYKAYDKIFYDDMEINFDIENICNYHRLSKIKEKMPDAKITEIFPGELLRDYEVFFCTKNSHLENNITTNTDLEDIDNLNVDNLYLRNESSTFKSKNSVYYVPIRQLLSSKIGKYILTRGLVTKTTQIKPILKLAAYICESCGSETFQSIAKDSFNVLLQCNSEKCKVLKIKPTLIFKNRASKFTTCQVITLSECIDDVSFGGIPRTIRVNAYGVMCGKVKPGDSIFVGGILLAKKDYSLLNETFIAAHEFFYDYKHDMLGIGRDTEQKLCINETKADKELKEHLGDHDENQNIRDTNVGANLQNSISLQNLCDNNIESQIKFIQSLVDSFAPEIYNYNDIKKILLLSLVGAPSKEKTFMKIRGTINILIVGDPGTAKSQLLKTVNRIANRGIYTTGKGSSGVGLTACKIKDNTTKEIVLEAGALVLSDNGVCCIDELDKMAENDRVSIHEVMEQQSISINKAGINTTLNARCSIIGAANPIKGSFKEERSVEWNLGLPISLVSRFDCVCLVKDSDDEEKDERLALHVTNHFLVDKDKDGAETDNNASNSDSRLSYAFMREYIKKAKQIDPILPKSLGKKLVEKYIQKRKENATLTPRYLLSLIRFALSHARLRLSSTVDLVDIEESLRLMDTNINIKKEYAFGDNHIIDVDKMIYDLLISNANLNNEIPYDLALNLCSEFGKDALDKVISMLTEVGVLYFENGIIRLLN